MCGIVGAIGVEQDVCLRMLNHQVNRGPDNTGWNLIDGVFLGHNRLSIIDLSKNGNQPMKIGRYSMVFNGEIYNYKELISYIYAYDDVGTCFPGNDAATLLQYINKYGIEEGLKSANGMYAYCIFDAILKQIHLITDRFGQKPLYYCKSGASFVFASSVSAIMETREKWNLNYEALNEYWKLGAPFGCRTLIEEIKKLPGSSHLVYDIQERTVKIDKYYSPAFQSNTNHIEDLVLDAIKKVKVSDVPIHILLSGGIDSTLVASQFCGGNAIHLDSPEYNYAHCAAEKFGIKLNKVNPVNVDVSGSLMDYAFQVGQPSMAALIPYVTLKETHNLGVKVAVSANGADELFFGYDRTTERTSEKQIKHIFRNCFELPECTWEIDDRLSSGRWTELQTYVQYDLNQTLDAASMCHSVEVRNPFLDHRLVEVALSIPEGKHLSMRFGRKSILKNMLYKMGFDQNFLTRNKLGFSLHSEIKSLEKLKILAWAFVKENKFLECNDKTLNDRDERYLKMAALSFYYWFVVWEKKLWV